MKGKENQEKKSTREEKMEYGFRMATKTKHRMKES